MTGIWHDRDVPFVRDADGVWRALIGIDVAGATGARTLRLRPPRPRAGPGPPRTPCRVAETRAHPANPRQSQVRHAARDRAAANRGETALLNALFGRRCRNGSGRRGASRPVEGVAVSGFGVRSVLNGQPRGSHNGLDLAAVTGTPVFAPTPGVVAFAREFYYSGNTVIVDHGQGLFSTMAHLSAIDVKEGERVAKGALLGKVGATGRVTGPHLHWAVRLHGDRVDPLSLLEALAASVAPEAKT